MLSMSEMRKPITQRIARAMRLPDRVLTRLTVPLVIAAGIGFALARLAVGDVTHVAIALFAVVLLGLLSANPTAARRITGGEFTGAQVVYVVMVFAFALFTLSLLRLLDRLPFDGKSSQQTYFALVLVIAAAWMLVRSVLLLTPFAKHFAVAIPIWEQVLLALNEVIAAGLLALWSGNLLVHTFQPNVFTTRLDPLYTTGIGFLVTVYYFGMQLMWTQRWNDWLSQNRVWVRLARLFALPALVVISMVIARRFIERTDPRTADLLSDADLDLALLALAPVIWMLVLTLTLLIFTSGRGLRRRFLPDGLLERLPARVGDLLRSISDMDMLLIIGVLATAIPGYLFLVGDSQGLIVALRAGILQGAGNLIETNEQALALLFTLPFYALCVLLLGLYGLAFVQPTLPARERESLSTRLPIGFLIILIITLYLFAIPFSQVLTEGRLPQLPQDLGRILAFNVVIPLVLLYAHYFFLIRLPYTRGQKRWRERQNVHYAEQLETIDTRIKTLNYRLTSIERRWAAQRDETNRVESLYQYVQLNGQRDDLNMERLGLVSEKQQLAEISETPVSIAVARLPVRVVSIGIPVLLAVQIYQWAILNDGLREVVNNPNITIIEFFQILLQQTQF